MNAACLVLEVLVLQVLAFISCGITMKEKMVSISGAACSIAARETSILEGRVVDPGPCRSYRDVGWAQSLEKDPCHVWLDPTVWDFDAKSRCSMSIARIPRWMDKKHDHSVQ